jgi:hypothetical protein
VSEVELQALVEGLADRAATAAVIRAAKESGTARRLLERLEDYTSEIPIERPPDLVAVLFEEGDGLRFESQGSLDFIADMQVARIIYQCLMRLPEADRQALLLASVTNAASLGTAINEAALAEPSDREGGRVLTDRAAWEAIRDAALPRIEAANQSGELWKLEKLQPVLFRWLEWSDAAHVQAAVAAHVANDQELLDFIAAFVEEGYSHTAGDKVGRKHVRISKKNLGHFMNLDEIRLRLASIASRGGEIAEYASNLTELLERKGRFHEE